jgi:predicted secreted protein
VPSPGRVQTPDLKLYQQLQPAAEPVNTYIRPPDPPRTNSLLQIADALGSVHDGLRQYAASERARANSGEEKQKVLDEIAVARASQSDEEFRKTVSGKIKDGSLPQSTRDAYAAASVLTAANDFRGQAAAAYDSDFDREHGDVVSWFHDYRAKAMQQFTDPGQQAAFVKATDPMGEQLIVGHQKYLADRLGQERITNATGNYELITEAALSHGTGTDIVKRHLEQAANDLKGTLKLTGPENDEALFSLAKLYATKGRSDVVEAILGVGRGGRGSLLLDPDTAPKAYELLQQSKKITTDQHVQDDPIKAGDLEARAAHGDATPAEISASPYHSPAQKVNLEQVAVSARQRRVEEAQKQIAEQQSLANWQIAKRTDSVRAYSQIMAPGGDTTYFADQTIPTKDGKGTETWSAEDQIKGVVKVHEDEVAAEAAKVQAVQGPQAAAKYAFNADVTFYSRIRQPNPRWKALFDSASMSVPDLLAAKGQVPDSVAQAGQLYKALGQTNAPLRDSMIKDDNTKLLLEAYNVASTTGNLPEAAAWQRAASIVDRKAKGELPSFFMKDADLDSAAKKVGAGYFTSGQDVTGDAREAVRKNAEMLFWSGVPVSEAVTRATDLVKKSYVIVNDRAVYMPDQALHDHFASLVEEQLHRIHTSYGEHAHLDSSDDLYIAPVANRTDAWTVQRKDGLGPLLDLNGAPVTITKQELDRIDQAQAVRDRAAQTTRQGEYLKAHPGGVFIPQMANRGALLHQGQENASKAYQQDITDEKRRNREGDILGQANAASGGMGDTGPTGMQLFGLPNYDTSAALPTYGGSRGLRNNNPGNIEYGDFAKGRGATGTDGRFAKFNNPAQGVQAMAALLRSYQGRGLSTVREMIDRWNPKSDGQPKNYVSDVAKAMGIAPDQPFDFGSNPELASRMIAAMIQQENGRNPYTPKDILSVLGG